MTFIYENQNQLDEENQAVLEKKIEDNLKAWKGEGIDFPAEEYRDTIRFSGMVYVFSVALLNAAEIDSEEGWLPIFGNLATVKRIG